MKQGLLAAEFSTQQINNHWMNLLDCQSGFPAQWSFWHRETEGEIDLLLSFSELIIGIEVKYLSGISSEDVLEQDQQIDYEESVNQLSRYSRMLERLSEGRDAYLLFLSPFEMMNDVRKRMEARQIISPFVHLGYIYWEDIYQSLLKLDLKQFETGQQMIIEDLRALLLKKGFVRFRGFDLKDSIPPITTAHYSYDNHTLKDKVFLNWPIQNIKGDQNYDYRITE